MRRTKVDANDERLVLSHCVADSQFLRAMHSVGAPRLFETQFARTVAGWVWDFFEETGQKEAPGRLISEIYHKRKSEVRDEEELDLVQEYIAALSNSWVQAEVVNPDWSIQQGVQYFKLRALKTLTEKLQRSLDLKDWKAAEESLGDFKRPELLSSRAISMVNDAARIARAYNNQDEILFNFPGALGEVVGPMLIGDFAAFFAPMKRGKSFWLKYCQYAAMRQGVKSLQVNLEMPEDQIARRDWQMICGGPREPGIITIPEFTETGDITWTDRAMESVPTREETIARAQRALKYTCRGGDMRTEVMPRSTTVSGIRGLVRRYKREGYNLRLLTVDYADLLSAENSKLDGRAALDWVWSNLRSLALEENICVVSASQTSRSTLERDAKESDAAEDVRKLAHVTKAIMLNQSDLERKRGIMRVKCNMQREGSGSSDEAVCLEQRALGRVCLDSRLRHQVRSDVVGRWKEDE